MKINGVDYTLPLVAALSFLTMFGVQFFLLRLSRFRFLRHLPWLWVMGSLALAVATLFGDTGGWLDLRSLFFALLCGYAAICAAGIGLAYTVNKLIKR